MSKESSLKEDCELTRHLLGLVALDRSHELVNLAPNSIFGALSVPLSLGGLVLGLSTSLLLLAGLLPGLSTSEITDSLLYESLSLLELASRFAVKSLVELEHTDRRLHLESVISVEI